MTKVAPFHTKNEEEHRRSPVWHDNDQCSEGKKIKPENREYGAKGNKCDYCKLLDGEK
jgi:hypothetical protein